MAISTLKTSIKKAKTVIEGDYQVEAEYYTEGDVTVHNYNAFPSIDNNTPISFTKADLSFYSKAHYVPPRFVETLFEKSLHNKVLIIHGGQGFDKGSLIRHLGHRIISEMSSFECRELRSNTEDKNLKKRMAEEGEKKVFILDKLHPQHFGYDIESIHDLANQKDFILLITTDFTIETWELSAIDNERYTFDVPLTDLYDRDVLSGYLSKRIREHSKTITNKTETITPYLTNGAQHQLATQLATPENIRLFIDILSQEQAPLKDDQLQEIVASIVNSHQPLVTKWFKMLKDKQKLIALGVALFEGLYEDQFFGIIQDVIQQHWKHSDASLQALDYVDLEFLYDYFNLEQVDDEKSILRNRFPNQRIDVIEAAWNTHRRHIISALAVITKAVHDSARKRYSNWEKYGTLQRQMNMRRIASNIIGDIGLVSYRTVENAMITLAAQNDPRLQRVTAKALARWREFDRTEELFVVLSEWLYGKRIENIVHLFLAENDNRDELTIGGGAISYLKITVLYTLSYASIYDVPNHLHLSIIELLKDIIKDENAQVRYNLKQALPRIIQHHFMQLKKIILENFIIYSEMTWAVAKGLSDAYEYYPKDVRATLFEWLDSHAVAVSKERHTKITKKEKVLKTVLETFQQITFGTIGRDVISLDEVYEWLVKLAKITEHRPIRKVYLLTLAKVASWDWNKAGQLLAKVFTNNNLDELDIVIDSFVGLYLVQRHELDGAKHEFTWNKRRYPIWLSIEERPNTDIEEALSSWMSSGNIILKRISTLAYLEFAKTFENVEQESIRSYEEHLEEQKKSEDLRRKQIEEEEKQEVKEPAISFGTSLKIFFLLLFEPGRNRQALRSILKLLNHRRAYYSKSHYEIVFAKWNKSDDHNTRKLAAWLEKFFRS